MRRKVSIIGTLVLGFCMLHATVFAQGLEGVKNAIIAEQYQSAMASLKKVLTLEKGDGAAYFYLGEIYLNLNQLDSAKAIFEKGSKVFPKNPLNFVGLGKGALKAGQLKFAKDYFSTAVNLTNKKDFLPHLYISQAHLAIDKPDLKAALASLDKAAKVRKKTPTAEIYSGYGDYYSAQKKDADALKSYQLALNTNSEYTEAAVKMARIYTNTGEFLKADSILKQITLQHPNYGAAYKALSSLYELWPDKDGAVSNNKVLAANFYKNYLTIAGNYYGLLVKYAELCYRAGDFVNLANSLPILNTFESSKNDLAVMRLNAYSAYENKDYNKAMHYLEACFAAIKDHTLITSEDYLYFGRTQLKLRQEDKAIFNILKAVEMDRTKSPFIAEIGQFYYSRRNWVKAIEYYQQADILPDAGNLTAAHAVYYATSIFFKHLQEKNTNSSKVMLLQAERLLKAAITKAPDDVNAHLWYARTLYLLEDPAARSWAMVGSYERYATLQELSVYPQSAATRRSLVEAYNVIASYASFKQDLNKASVYWNKALSLDPQNSEAIAGIKSLNVRMRANYKIR